MKIVLFIMLLMGASVLESAEYDAYLLGDAEILYKDKTYYLALTSVTVTKKYIWLVAANGDKTSRPLRKIRKSDGALLASSRRVDIGEFCDLEMVKASSGGKQWMTVGQEHAVICEQMPAIVINAEFDSREDPRETVHVCHITFPHRFSEQRYETLLTLHNYSKFVVRAEEEPFPEWMNFCSK